MKSDKVALKLRRKSALERLEIQLKKGTKPVNEFSGADAIPKSREYPLTESDKKRIQKEIKTLNSRL